MILIQCILHRLLCYTSNCYRYILRKIQTKSKSTELQVIASLKELSDINTITSFPLTLMFKPKMLDVL